MLWEVRSLAQLLLLLLVAGAGTQTPRKEVQVVWAKEGFPVQLPCVLSSIHQNLSRRHNFLWKVTVIWQRWQDRTPQANWYTVFRVGPAGLRSVRLPPQPRLQLGGLSLHQGDFSLWLRPAWLSDAGEYRAQVHFEHGDLRCHLCLRFGRAFVTASPPGPIVTSGLVLLNCSFDRPDLPEAVLWSRGQVPISPSSRHFPVGSLLFLSHVTLSDAGPWDCCVIYPDGFNVSTTHHLTVLGLEPLTQKTVYVGEGSKVELPCHLSPAPGTMPGLIAQWTLPWGRGSCLVSGDDKSSFALRLDHVSRAQAGTYNCSLSFQGHQLSAVVTLAVITVTAKSFGSSSSRKGLLCEVTPVFRQEHFLWTTLDNQTLENPPGPWLELGDEELQVDQWRCQVYQGTQQCGAIVYNLGLQGTDAQLSERNPKALKGGKQLPLLLSLGILLLLFGVGAAVFRLRQSQVKCGIFSLTSRKVDPQPTGPSPRFPLLREPASQRPSPKITNPAPDPTPSLPGEGVHSEICSWGLEGKSWGGRTRMGEGLVLLGEES
ncbi:lymphocyte activation gene 3 protein isoform X3 [Trichosurus vulpecula]|uniref:lymphocyte activation gene 3 protein isoform X3 n=1 Tax=Trichosurus vulpecula TaxID=9337 RepID=UPI00186B19D5|nr:lymphocyte activation gene 3 protein isoform X3 [Trichosurus vulpecula]